MCEDEHSFGVIGCGSVRKECAEMVRITLAIIVRAIRFGANDDTMMTDVCER